MMKIIKNPSGVELRKDEMGVYWLAIRLSADLTHVIQLTKFIGNTSHWDAVREWADKQLDTEG